MRISVLSIAPETFSGFRETAVISRAVGRGAISFECIDIRDYAEGSFRKIDDSPYGGGRGMILRVDTVFRALEAVRGPSSRVVMLSPKGQQFTQKKAREYSKLDHLVLLCGHYEGFDARISRYVDEEISIGDYILTGGELPAMIVCDSVVRLLDGSLREGSADDESFETGLLEYPQYTHPFEFNGDKVPEILLSGNDADIAYWRQRQAVIDTVRFRPDLFDSLPGEKTGLSGAKTILFDSCVLKIQESGPRSDREVQAMQWLKGKLSVPEVLYHADKDGMSYTLMTRLKGKMLCDPQILHNRNRLLKSAAAALKMLWSVDVSNCPFREEGRGIGEAVLVHGDFCLPNILADNSGITGFLDLGYCTVGEKHADVETCIESLEANLTGKFSDGSITEPLDREAFLTLV